MADRPTSAVDVLGEDGLDAFTALSEVHADGWGIAWHDPTNEETRCASSPDAAVSDATYGELMRRRAGTAGLVHLRWATGGLAVAAENTHPFTADGYAFAHNGHVAPLERLESLLTPRSRGALQGDTDSERYFRFVMQCIAESGDETEAVSKAVGVLMDEFPDSSLNSLLLTPDRMIAVHVNSRADSPAALRELFEVDEAMPHRHASEYFAMDYRVTADTVQVISSGLNESGWTPVPPNSAVVIDLGCREVTTVPLGAARDTSRRADTR